MECWEAKCFINLIITKQYQITHWCDMLSTFLLQCQSNGLSFLTEQQQKCQHGPLAAARKLLLLLSPCPNKATHTHAPMFPCSERCSVGTHTRQAPPCTGSQPLTHPGPAQCSPLQVRINCLQWFSHDQGQGHLTY